MYLSPPDVHCLGPIKMELSEPQANLQAALQVLELHHSKLNTTKVHSDCISRVFLTRVTHCCLVSGSDSVISLYSMECLTASSQIRLC